MAVVVIRYDGTDITDSVIYSDAQFTMQVNGIPGTCAFRVRDDSHTMSFSTGKELTLDINGIRMWGGFVSLVSSIYSSSVVDTTNAGAVVREFRITGVDYNIFFDRRILFNKASPTRRIPLYPRNVRDDVAIQDIASRFLDLTGDGLSLSGIDFVGTPNPDMAGNLGAPADSWGLSMNVIARYTGAVYFIDPDKVVNYIDSHSANTSYYLTDQPNPADPFAVGYRELALTSDASTMDNDALVWGAGQGSNHIHFKRIQSTASEALHGRWQVGEFDPNLYTDGALTSRASTMVFGSPQNRRGAKDDAVTWEVTTFKPVFKVGDVTTIMVKSHDRGSNQDPPFDTDKTWPQQTEVPIRRMTVTFPAKTDPMFRLLVSHNIDLPWMGYEFWFPNLHFKFPSFPEIPPPVLPGTGGGIVCVIFDNFARTTGPDDWGSSTPTNVPWSIIGGSSPEVTGGFGTMSYTDGIAEVTISDANLPANLQPGQTVILRAQFKLSDIATTGENADEIQFQLWNSQTRLTVVPSTEAGIGGLLIADNTTGPLIWADYIDWSVDTLYYVEWSQVYNGAGNAKIWRAADPEPTTWLATTATSHATPNGHNNFTIEFTGNGDTTALLSFKTLDFCAASSGISCSLLDSFNRVETGTLGVTDAGARPWQIQTNTVDAFGCGIGGVVTNGAFAQTTTSGRLKSYLDTLPTDIWAVGTYFQFLIIFRMESHVGVSFTIALSDSTQLAVDESQIYWQASINNSGTLFASVGSDVWADGTSFSNPGFVVDTDYIMEGYVENEVSAGIRVYKNGDPVPDFTSFTFSTGGSSSVGPGLILNVRADAIHSSSVFYWRDLVLCSRSTASAGPSAGQTCETFLGGGDAFNTAYPYVGGFVQVFINGVLQRLIDDYIEANSASGLIALTVAAGADDIVVICYIIAGYTLA